MVKKILCKTKTISKPPFSKYQAFFAELDITTVFFLDVLPEQEPMS